MYLSGAGIGIRSTPYAGGTDPHGAATGSNRVLRGGYWRGSADRARCAYRDYVIPGTPSATSVSGLFWPQVSELNGRAEQSGRSEGRAETGADVERYTE